MALPQLPFAGRGTAQTEAKCLCLEWFPFEEKCRCRAPVLPSLARSGGFSASAPSLVLDGGSSPSSLVRTKGREGEAKGRVQELKHLGLAELPSCQRLRGTDVKETLLKARSSGKLEGLRAAVRGARQQLGLDDPLVVKVGNILRKAEHCLRTCRDFLAQDSLRELPASMAEVEQAVLRVKGLGLGPRLWEEPLLNFARERAAQWRAHRPALEDLIAKLREGPAAFCAAWAELALSDSELKVGFGAAVTKELLQIPDAGIPLAAALQKAVKVLPEAAFDEYEFVVLRLMRISSLLGTLDKSALDMFLLKRDPSGKTAFWEAAAQPDSVVFYALYQSMTCELLTISVPLQQRIEQAAAAAANATLPSVQLTAELLGQKLGVRASDLNLQCTPCSGIVVRLFPETTRQPTAQQAQEALGNGAVAGYVSKPAELKRWGKTSIRRMHEDIVLCRRTRDQLAADSATFAKATAEDEAARTDLAAARAEYDRCVIWAPAAEKEVKDAQEYEMTTMRASREAMMAEGLGEGTAEESEAAKLADEAATARHADAKADVIASRDALAAATAWKQLATVAAPKFAAALKVATAAAENSTAAFASATQAYEATIQGPLQPTDEQEREASKSQAVSKFGELVKASESTVE